MVYGMKNYIDDMIDAIQYTMQPGKVLIQRQGIRWGTNKGSYCCNINNTDDKIVWSNGYWHTKSCASGGAGSYYNSDQDMSRCECGAKHTGFPNHHFRWCPMYDERYYK